MITVLNILLIEDNPGDIRLLQEILREVTTTRCQITPVMTLAEAIDRLASIEDKAAKGKEHSRFDAILLDLSLPDSQGLSSFLTLHQRNANIPIIVLTGLDDQNLAISAMQQGAQDYLVKGQVDSNLLLRSIRYAIERERAETALRQAKIDLERRVLERTQDLQQINDRLQQELLERHKAEAALQISQSRFAGILEIASDAIIAVDGNYKIALFNQGAEQIFGYPASEAIGQSLDLLLPVGFIDVDRERIRWHLTPELSTGERVARPLENRKQVIGTKRDGSQFPAEASISYLEFGTEKVTTIILRDVTQRQQIENDLRNALQKVNFHFENSPLAAIEWDREFRVSRWSATAEKIFGWSSAQVLGKRPNEWKFVVPEDADRISEIMARLTAGIEVSNVTINRNYCQDGTIVSCEWYNSVQLDDTRCMASIFSLVLDVTDRHQMERIKDEFIAIVSHELRTPMTSIYGSLKMLDSGLLHDQPEKEKRLLTIAVDSTDRLMRLVNDILDIERIESGTVQMVKSVCKVSELMAKAVDAIEPIAERAGVQLSVSDTGGQVWVDSDRMIQTFTNLLGNAIKFSPSGSTIWFTATKQTGQMLFQVRDCGRGIPSDKLGVIFERFQQVDASDARSGEGTGLGLAICRSIIEQHGGNIWVESVLGEGSTFSCIIPRSPSPQDSNPSSKLGINRASSG
ncbi:PAS domain S-box protein [Chamaesiphon minutus]|uniref:histidine kinase n=1 Tax=Chamaesiphon minutus (strain ATCC 27169 / PCC 6605) TaxID=1173020 RepID=K9UN26_CHAP6|nr:PAS domain S-box protein [Chamaesiphon minutus]AFY95816.1 PAS domain S-box [Chamaesiphon minutus PCC 6605]